MARQKKANMTPTPVENSNVVKFTARKKVFDFDKFERKTVEQPGEFTKPKDLAEALSMAGGDASILLTHATQGLLKAAKSEAKKSIQTSGGSAKTVNTFVNTFRLMPTFSKISERTEQTKAIYAFIQSMPDMLAQIKQAAIDALATEEDDDENDEENKDEK